MKRYKITSSTTNCNQVRVDYINGCDSSSAVINLLKIYPSHRDIRGFFLKNLKT